MAYGQKVSLELGEVACYMRWISMAKRGCVIETISVPYTQRSHRILKRVLWASPWMF
ncbi:unnamed protein product [Hymenolepis diminuta]|uniref:Uncharacterized protein n=1 Tax=Hymenolepis diminuta TaxID=6216 RepID=A0A564YAQ2_HYMDI|nr:unnamed protein product [Hymenolepis diminuta]